MTLALVYGPIVWPALRQCASVSSSGDAMQKLDTGGPSAVRVQQLPAAAGAVVQGPVAESHALPGWPGVSLNRGLVQSSGDNHIQAETTRSQQPTAPGVVVVDVVDVVIVDDVVVEPGTDVVLVVVAGDPFGQAMPSAAAFG